MGVSEKGGAAPKDLLAVCCCQRGLAYNSLLAQKSQVWFHIIAFKTRWMFAVVQEGFVAALSSDSSPARFGSSFSVFRSSVLLIFASGCFGVVFVNPLFVQLHPDLLHLPSTVKSLRVTRLKNLLCPLSTGCFKGNNLVTVFMTEVRLACVCVLASRPAVYPRHGHARTCAMAARCVCKKRTRSPCHRRSRRVSHFIAVRVGEATHRGPLSTKHLRCPHCPTWLSHRSSLRNHILRFHEPPPPTSSPVLSEWSFSEADAVEEGKRRRHRGPRSWEARQRRLGRREPSSIGHEEFTILHYNVRGFISRVAELSARLRLMESKPSVLCLTETWADKGLPSLRIEGYTLISRRDRDDGRLGGGVAVFALEKLAHRVTPP